MNATLAFRLPILLLVGACAELADTEDPYHFECLTESADVVVDPDDGSLQTNESGLEYEVDAVIDADSVTLGHSASSGELRLFVPECTYDTRWGTVEIRADLPAGASVTAEWRLVSGAEDLSSDKQWNQATIVSAASPGELARKGSSVGHFVLEVPEWTSSGIAVRLILSAQDPSNPPHIRRITVGRECDDGEGDWDGDDDECV